MEGKKSGRKTRKRKFHFVCVKCRIGIEVEDTDREKARGIAQRVHDAYHERSDMRCNSHVLRHRIK